MTISQVQVAGFTETTQTSSGTATPGATTTAGNTLFAFVSLRNTAGNSPTVSSVTDDAGNTWTRVAGSSTTALDAEVWWVANAASATAITVTCTASATMAFEIQEWSGLGNTPSVDQTAQAHLTGTTESATTAATTSAVDLVLGFGMAANATEVFSAQTAGFTLGTTRASAVTGQGVAMQTAWLTTSATGTQTYGFTVGTSAAIFSTVVAIAPGTTVTGSASPAAQSSLTAAGTVEQLGAATAAATGSLAVTGVVTQLGSVAPAAIGSLAGAGVVSKLGAVTPAAQGSITATGAVVKLGSASPAGVGSMTSAGVVSKLGSSSPAARGSFAAGGLLTAVGAAALGGTFSLGAVGQSVQVFQTNAVQVSVSLSASLTQIRLGQANTFRYLSQVQ